MNVPFGVSHHRAHIGARFDLLAHGEDFDGCVPLALGNVSSFREVQFAGVFRDGSSREYQTRFAQLAGGLAPDSHQPPGNSGIAAECPVCRCRFKNGCLIFRLSRVCGTSKLQHKVCRSGRDQRHHQEHQQDGDGKRCSQPPKSPRLRSRL